MVSKNKGITVNNSTPIQSKTIKVLTEKNSKNFLSLIYTLYFI